MRPDPTLLAFDTSAAHCAAALLSDGRAAVERYEDMGRGQAERLMPLLEEMLDDAGLSWRDLDALAVGTGPGNFTGIRIAVATARGLSMALGIPAIGVTGFAALAAQCDDAEAAPLLVSLTAPRNQAYVEPWVEGRPAGPARLIDPAHVPGDLMQGASGLRVTGHRAGELAGALGASIVTTSPINPALAVAAVAARRLSATAGRDTLDALTGAPPAPVYVRPADAAPAREAPPVILP